MSYFFELIEGHDAYTSTMAFTLYELDQNFFPTPWSKDSWEKLFAEHDRSLIIAHAQNLTIGFSLFDVSRADSFAHLLKILLNPEHRGKGVAGQLLSEAMSVLTKQGIRHFFLEVEEENHAAQKLYQSCGFKVIHKKKDFYGQGRAALIMTADHQ